MVFAPHPDDETLGCGGTVIQKRALGAEIQLVFMTDGSGSHRHLISAETLAAMRKSEAMAAAAALGVGAYQVRWLGFPDGGLTKCHNDAVSKVHELLCANHPAQVFVPFPINEHPDHVSTRTVVLDALAKACRCPFLCEYPIWYMHNWPFVQGEPAQPEELPWVRPDAWFGLRLLREFNVCVDLTGVADDKRKALAAHQTQIARPNGDPRWPILGDISGGEFLANFFETEIFRCRDLW